MKKKETVVTFRLKYAVQWWYDRHARSWVTVLVDHDGNQIGDASYDAQKVGRDCSIKEKKQEADKLNAELS